MKLLDNCTHNSTLMINYVQSQGNTIPRVLALLILFSKLVALILVFIMTWQILPIKSKWPLDTQLSCMSKKIKWTKSKASLHKPLVSYDNNWKQIEVVKWKPQIWCVILVHRLRSSIKLLCQWPRINTVSRR